MWSLATNEKFAAVLIAIWVVFLANFVGNRLVPIPEPTHAEGSHAAAPSTEKKAAQPAKPAKPATPFPVLLAAASAKDGAKIANKCKSCHTFEAGGKNKVGPNLHNVVGRKKGSKADFNYSSALKGLGGTWTYEDLNHFLTNPRDFAKGTKMTFAGLKKAKDRAEVIQFLRSITDSPPPLPKQ